jgi:DNA-binding MarR family transcriptional regulator
VARTPEIGEGFRGRDGSVAFLLRQAHGAWRTAIDDELETVGISGPQYSVLNVVRLLPGLSGSELARASMLTQQTTNEIVLALTRRRLIARAPRAENRRVLELVLTPAGRAVIVKARRIVRRLERRMVASINDEEQAVLRSWLVSCAQNLATPRR